MKLGNHATAAVAALTVALASTDAGAVCDQSSASQADTDLWSTHDCWRDFYLWHYQEYDTRSGDWGDRGWNDACNVVFEYPKHWNAAYLVTYGMLDDHDQSFHATTDYRQLAEAPRSDFHNDFYHLPIDDTSVFGAFEWEPFSTNKLETSCLLYNPSVANANPASRAGDFMHEGWHAWMSHHHWDNGSVGGHRPGPQGACAINGCDYFYFHGIGAFEFGALYQTDGTASHFHSPNQVQVEFLCDVADESQWWVPASVRQAAQVDANTRAGQRFINGPGYTCGSPRPW